MSFFHFDETVTELSVQALADCAGAFEKIEKTTEYNQLKVLSAFIQNGVTESQFAASTGYGYGDRGRETLDSLAAQSLGAQAALVRHSFASGTATLTTALFGILRPGDTMLCVSGTPYDTIRPVIGLSGEGGMGSLKDFGIGYREIDLLPDSSPDLEGIKAILRTDQSVKMVYIQRSRGYSLRRSLSVAEIGAVADVTHKNSCAVVMVDNCYGEFVETAEPPEVGADLIAGSLIKNPGGGIARSGGYIAGKKEYVELCAYRMTAPGVGGEVGASLGNTRDLMLGWFNAPHVTGEALKTAVFASALFGRMGYKVSPGVNEKRADIIQSVFLNSPEKLTAFCRGLQKCSPVDSFAVPEPWDMPGYDCKVIMAAGAFTLGSSIELSADAPLREPYAVWMQGGLNFHSAKAGILSAASAVMTAGEPSGR